jgi:hypothetical protein
MSRCFCPLIKTENLAQEKHGDQEREGDHGGLVHLLGDDVGNQGEDQGLLDPWTLRVLFFADLDIGDGFNSVHLILNYIFLLVERYVLNDWTILDPDATISKVLKADDVNLIIVQCGQLPTLS